MACALICLAVPAAAQDGPAQFSLPPGCDAYLTVQKESCEVTHHFVCQSDPAGHQRRVVLTEDGMIYLGHIDAETRWIESVYFLSGRQERLAPGASDPASFSELVEKGVDTYDFETLSDQIGNTRYVGEDRLTGRLITIDDVTLQETEYEITAYDAAGNEIARSTGNQYISQDWQMFLSGTAVTVTPNGSFEQSERPFEFIFPGEPGFLSSRPKHGCGATTS